LAGALPQTALHGAYSTHSDFLGGFMGPTSETWEGNGRVRVGVGQGRERRE